MTLVDFDPILEPCLNIPPCLLFILPGILTCSWLNTLGTITQSHCGDQTSFDDCVELWVISFLEINHIFPLIALDISELLYLSVIKGQSIGLLTAIVDGESQLSKEVNAYV